MIDLPLDRTAQGRVRPVSRAVFKSDFALELMTAIAQEDRFYSTGLAELAPGCKVNYVSESLVKRLLAAGLIEAAEKPPGQQRDYYRRRPSPLWELVAPWMASLLDEGGSNLARLPQRP